MMPFDTAPETVDLSAVDPIEEGLRHLGRAAAAGLLAGLVVGGIGGRIVMRISAIAADSDGLLTEGGNRVGDITVGGTVALIIFGGGFAGIAGGMALFVLGPWLPGRLALRALAFAVVLPAIAGATTIAAENRDFIFLDPPELNIALFLLLFAAFGATAVFLEAKFDDLLPRLVARTTEDRIRYEASVFLVPALLLALLLFADAKPFEASFLLVIGVATSMRLAEAPSMARPLLTTTVIGYAALAAACLAGTLSLAAEIEKLV